MTDVPPTILIVDDEEITCTFLAHLMEREGFQTVSANCGKTALSLMRSQLPDVVLLDIMMPDLNGMEVLKEIKQFDSDIAVVMITGNANVQGAVEAMRCGAHDYLAKPFSHNEVTRVVQRALNEQELRRKVKVLSTQVKDNNFLRNRMGPSDVIDRLIAEVNLVAKSNFSVVIIGETGSGKELVARAIHQTSPRSEGPFIPVDCGAIPEGLLETELFGHEKGAFTGAVIQKPGKFEVAQGGTLFLDEIGNMPLVSQAKVLRAVQEKKVSPVGSTKLVNVDARIIVASNQNLQTLVAKGSFRSDLFFRLNEFVISIPALRERKDDIPYLAKLFLDTTNRELNKSVKGFSEEAIEALLNYNWPGNVRQFRSVIRRAVLIAETKVTEKHLEFKRVPVPGLAFTPRVQGAPWTDMSLKEIVRRSTFAVEREVLSEVLKYTGGNKARAARILKVDYKTLHTKVKEYKISVTGDGHDKTQG